MIYDPDATSPASSIGAMDALTLAAIDAVHNTYRGACVVLGSTDPAVVRFEAEVQGIKALRNRLEHFDAYLRGEGFAQRERNSPPLTMGDKIGLAIPMSGGGPGGHSIIVTVQEKDCEKTYTLRVRPAVEAARRLARAVTIAVGFDDQRHQGCVTCLS